MFEFFDVASLFSCFSDLSCGVSFCIVFCENLLLEVNVHAANVACSVFLVRFVEVAYDLGMMSIHVGWVKIRCAFWERT